MLAVQNPTHSRRVKAAKNQPDLKELQVLSDYSGAPPSGAMAGTTARQRKGRTGIWRCAVDLSRRVFRSPRDTKG